MNDFVTQLRNMLGDDLRGVTVFGSKARGDAHSDSDIDVLVVARSRPECYRTLWDEVADIAWQVELAHGVVLSLVLKSDTEFDRMRRAGLLLATEIDQDGVDLWIAAKRSYVRLRITRAHEDLGECRQ